MARIGVDFAVAVFIVAEKYEPPIIHSLRALLDPVCVGSIQLSGRGFEAVRYI